MRNGKKEYIYLHMQESERFVVSFGPDFSSFMTSLSQNPQYLLLLDHPFEDVEFDMHTLFTYIPKSSYQKNYKENQKDLGRLCWIDFDEEECLEELESWELAEILYLRHTKSHLRAPFYKKINNRFVYLSDEDGWYNKVYYRDWNDFYGVTGGQIALLLESKRLDKTWFGNKRKASYPPVPNEIIKRLMPFFEEGSFISIQKTQQSRNGFEIPIWTIGDYRDANELEEDINRIIQTSPDARLFYQRKTKEWGLSLHK